MEGGIWSTQKSWRDAPYCVIHACVYVINCSVSHEKRVKELTHQLRDMTHQHDSDAQRMTELSVQMKIIEDSRDAAKRDLADAADNIRRGTSLSHTYAQ